MFRCCLNYFKWGLVATLLAGLGIWLYVGQHVDEELRREVEARLAELYPHLRVSVESARLVKGEGIHLRGVRVADPQLSGWQAELAAADEIMLACDTSLKKLVQGDVLIRRFVLRRPKLNATRLADGTWSVAKLLKLHLPAAMDQDAPEGVIESGTVEIVDADKPVPSRYTLREVNLTLSPVKRGGREVLKFTSSFQGDHLRTAELHGKFHPEAMAMTLAGQINGLEVSPALLASMPLEAKGLEMLTPLQARANVKIESVSFDSRRAEPWRYDTTTTVHEGRIEHPSLPYPLRQLHATVKASHRGLKVESLTASNRQTTLRLSALREGWTPDAKLTVWIEGRRVLFDQRLLHALPQPWREIWREYSPEGEVDVTTAKFVVENGRWHPPTLELVYRDVAFAYYEYPYRLTGTTGTLSLSDDHLDFDLTAHARGVPVKLRGDLRNVSAETVGWIDARAKNLQIEQGFIDALPAEDRSVVAAFHPSGTFDAHLHVIYQAQMPRERETLTLALRDCFVRYQDFPYPVSKISGVIQRRDGVWTFKDLKGHNGSGQIAWRGYLRPTPRGEELFVEFTGQKIALDDELRAALPHAARQTWASLRPQGFVNLGLKLRQRPGLTKDNPVEFIVDVYPLEETVTIEPVAFPYRLEKLRGHIRYHDGTAELHQLRAEHGDVRWRAQGTCRHGPGGSWALRFSDLGVDRLRVDRDVLRALPNDFGRFLAGLDPTGPINLRGAVDFSQGGLRGDPLNAAWDLHLICHGNTIRAGVKLEGLFGGVRISGDYRNNVLRCDGRLDLESLTYHGFQVTQVQGPFQVRDGRMFFGAPLSRAFRYGPEHITARCYGGVLYGDCWTRRGAFSLRANLERSDLGRFSREAVVARRSFSGRANAHLSLNGTSQGVHSLQGTGAVRLTDADIYELPVMLSLLKVLTLEQPDLTAFTTSDIDFRIQGSHVYLDRIDFKGDALSLYGRGTMDFDRRLQLTFRPELGSSRVRVPLFSELLGGAGGQILGNLYVGGTLNEPDVRREPFADIKEAWENLQRPAPLFQPGSMDTPGARRTSRGMP